METVKVLSRCCHRSVVALFPLLKNCRSLLCLISLNVFFFCFFKCTNDHCFCRVRYLGSFFLKKKEIGCH